MTNQDTGMSSRFAQKRNELSFTSLAIGYRFDPKNFKFLQACRIASMSLNATIEELGRISSLRTEWGVDYPFARTLNVSFSGLFNKIVEEYEWKNLLLSAICIVSLFLSSCQNWIDVNPKTDIEAEEFFTSEDGFKSVLTGLYSMMVLEKSYGRQMTFDFVEKLVQRYDNYAAGTVTDEERAAIYKYGETTSSKNAIAEIWLKLYNEIANINNFLQYLESNGDVIVTEGYRDLMKGEALGLRAFHYFDLLRLWGPIYTQDSTKACIPYREQFNSESAPLMAA